MHPIIKVAFILIGSMLFVLKNTSCQQLKATKGHEQNPYYSTTDTSRISVTNAQWKKILSKQLYAVAREQATERAFSGQYWNKDVKGIYYCAVCGNVLFKSTAKFASACGWPSFFEPIRKNSVVYKSDNNFDMHRTEVICARCQSHLGHIFDDGPPPTHKRFCMNSISLDFEPVDTGNN